MSRVQLLSDDQTDVALPNVSTTGSATCLGMSQELADVIAKREVKRQPFGFVASEPKVKRQRKRA